MTERFVFRLGKIYQLAQEKVKAQELRVKAALDLESEARMALDRMEDERRQSLQLIRRNQQRGVTADTLSYLIRFTGFLARGVAAQADRVEQIQAVCADEKEELLRLRRDEKALEKLRARKEQEHFHELRRRDQKVMDEAALNAHHRGRETG